MQRNHVSVLPEWCAGMPEHTQVTLVDLAKANNILPATLHNQIRKGWFIEPHMYHHKNSQKRFGIKRAYYTLGQLRDYLEDHHMAKTVFVFGSNEAGIHGGGAAKTAYEKHGARWGKSYGHYGDSFAIPTKDETIETISLEQIQKYVQGFLAYAKGHRKLTFKVTCIGCGLAMLKQEDIAPMFKGAPKNCTFDELWRPWLGDEVTYWGTW